MTEWKPIESAPETDDFEVWNWRHDEVWTVCRFKTAKQFPNAVIHAGSGKWFTATHWRPKSAPPATPQEDK